MKQFVFIILLICLLMVWFHLDMQKGRKDAAEARKSSVHYADFNVYTDGHVLYDALFADIRNSTKYIYLHFFIIRNDEISKSFLSLLEEKAKQGVEVKLSVDRVGSFMFKKSMKDGLRKAGVQFSFSGKPAFPYIFYSLLHRNHRRMAVIDGITAYTGGFNMGKEHLDQDKRLGNWKDYHYRIHGDGAHEMERQFLLDWKKDTGQNVPLHSTSAEKGSNRYEYVFADGKGLAERYKERIKNAKRSIMIATPYFIPGKEIINDLIEARKRGVSLKVLVPLNSDTPLMKQANYPYLRELLKHGADIYLYQNGFFHGKIVIFDGQYVVTGTPNFDSRSFYLNDESVCTIYEGPVITEIQKKLNDDFQKSERISDHYFKKLNLWDRFLEKTASVISYYL